MKKTIAEHMKDILLENNLADGIVNFGDVHLLGECAERAELKQQHPIDRNQAVINALARSKLFEKVGYIKVHFKGNRYWRNFKLIP
jgi:hypothetical protein